MIMEILRKDLKKILLQSGCAIALMAGVVGSANAQLAGSLGVGATGITNGGGFGMNASAWVPFMGFGAYVEGGFQDGNPYGDIGLGGRFMVGGNIGLGGLVSFATQKGDESDKMFYAIKPTFEVGFGGLTFSSTLQIPVGKKERTVKNSGSAQGELRNQPGNTNCSAPPMGTVSRVCDVRLVGREQSVEKNSFGVNLNAQYELNLGGFAVTPNVGVYMYDRTGKNLVGVQGGVKVGLALGNGLAIEGGIGFRHDNKNKNYDNDNRTQAIFTAGLTWHFGGNAASASTNFVDRPFSRSVFNRGIHTQEKLGNSFAERARLKDSTSNTPIDRVEFVDSTVADPTTKIDNLAANRVIIIQGAIILGNLAIEMDTNTAVLGGDSSVTIVGVTSGRENTFLTPGARGVVRQTNNVVEVFRANGSNNVIFQGLDIQSNGTAQRGIVFTNADNGQVRDVVITDVINQGVLISGGSDNALVTNVRISGAGTNNSGVIEVHNSQNTRIEVVTIANIATNARGILLDNAAGTFITGADISDNNNDSSHGVFIRNGSQNVTVQNSIFNRLAGDGIRIDGATTGNIRLLNLQITDGVASGDGIHVRGGAGNVLLSNINIIGGNRIGIRGVNVQAGSQNIQLQNVHAENEVVGFGLTGAATSIVDLGGNRFTAVGMQDACDGAADVVGGVNVTTTNTGVVALCR